MAAAVAALGLTLLLGQAGQLSLGHSFFLAVGAYGYTLPGRAGGRPGPGGLALPPVLAAVLAVLLAGVADCCSARSRPGCVASTSASPRSAWSSSGCTSSTTHRGSPAATTAAACPSSPSPALRFGSPPGQPQYLLNVLWGREQKLWYLFLVVTVVAYLYFRNLVRGRPGRALRAVRDRELMAGIIGVP